MHDSRGWSVAAGMQILTREGAPQQVEAVQIAYAAALAAGYRGGAASGNPVAFLRDLFVNEIAPAVQHNLRLFKVTARETLAQMRKEGYAGPISQSVYVHVALADALVSVLGGASDSFLAWESLGAADWISFAICFLMWLRADEHFAELQRSVEAALADE